MEAKVRYTGLRPHPSWVVDFESGYINKEGKTISHPDFMEEEEATEVAYRFNQGIICTKEKTKKDTNPKEALGVRKVPFHCLPLGVVLRVALAFMEGGRKYGTHNYRAMGVRASTYIDAVMARHLPAWIEGEEIDPDSGLHHIDKAIACLFVLRDSMLMNNWIDDRPVKYPNGLEIDKLNKLASDIIDKYPNAVEPFTEELFQKGKFDVAGRDKRDV
jgi:hypothetical protein